MRLERRNKPFALIQAASVVVRRRGSACDVPAVRSRIGRVEPRMLVFYCSDIAGCIQHQAGASFRVGAIFVSSRNAAERRRDAIAVH